MSSNRLVLTAGQHEHRITQLDDGEVPEIARIDAMAGDAEER